MFKHLPDDIRGKRDRAIFLVGIAGAFRRDIAVLGRTGLQNRLDED